MVGLAGSVRENVRLRRGFRLAAPGGVVGAYVHSAVAPGLGRIAGLVSLQSSSGALAGAAAVGAQVRAGGCCRICVAAAELPSCMHRAAGSARFLPAAACSLRGVPL